MAMTLEEALAFRLPNGKAIREASPEEWAAELERCQRELDELEAKDTATMTEQERQQTQARLDRMREFSIAVEVVKENL